MTIRDTFSPHLRNYDVSRAPPPAQTPAKGEAGIFAIVLRRKLTVAACMALAVAAGVGYIALTPPRYMASTAILIDPRLGKTVGSDPVQPGFIADNNAMDSQIKLLTSQTVLSRAAKMADLKNDKEFNGSDRSLLQRLLHPLSTLEDAVDLKALENAITIKRPERTYVVSIEVLARDPAKAAEIANDISKAYIEDQISSRVTAARDDTQFVRQRLDQLSGEIKNAENKVEAFKTKNNVVDSSGLRSNEQQVADLTRALGEARTKMSDAQARLDEVNRLARSGRLDATTEAERSLTMERLRQQEAETEQSVAKLAMTLGPQHPALVEAKGRQTKLEGLIRAELQRVGLGARSDYQAARMHVAQIAKQLNEIKTQSINLSRNLVPLEQLERNVKVLRASFERFAQVNDNISQQESETPPGRIIAIAHPPVSPAQPKKTVVGIVSLSAGLFFGLAAALLMEGSSPRQGAVYEAPVEPARPRQPARPPNGRRYWDDQDEDLQA